MQLLVVRHAIAEDRATFARTGQDDGQRPLTDEGRQRMQLAAAGLRSLVGPLDLIAASPLTRARETAEIVAEAFDGMPVETAVALSPGRPPEEVIEWLQHHAALGRIAIVGHEPDLSDLVSVLLLDEGTSFFVFKKGGACLLEFSGRIGPGDAILRWLLRPKHLRALGAASA
jgi:phosphohistidine phosphatase